MNYDARYEIGVSPNKNSTCKEEFKFMWTILRIDEDEECSVVGTGWASNPKRAYNDARDEMNIMIQLDGDDEEYSYTSSYKDSHTSSYDDDDDDNYTSSYDDGYNTLSYDDGYNTSSYDNGYNYTLSLIDDEEIDDE